MPSILADSGGAGSIILFVLMALFGIGATIYEKFKKAKEEAEFRERMQEEHRRRRVEGKTVPPPAPETHMEQASPPPQATVKPVRVPHAAPAPVQRTRPVSAAPEPAPVSVMQQAKTTLEDGVSASMQRDFSMTTEAAAAASMQSLSDAELAALAALRAGKSSSKVQATAVEKSRRNTGALIPGLPLSGVQALRTAMLYKEILDKPVALR